MALLLIRCGLERDTGSGQVQVDAKKLKLPLLGFLLVALSGCDLVYVVGLSAQCKSRPTPVIEPATLPPGKVGTRYYVKFDVKQLGTPLAGAHIGKGKLPKGLVLFVKKEHGHEFEIHGTPLEAGEYKFTLEAIGYGTQCVGMRGTRNYTLEIKPNR